MVALLSECNLVRCEVAPQFFMDYERDIFVEVHMDDLHGTGTERAIAALKKELEATLPRFGRLTARGPLTST